LRALLIAVLLLFQSHWIDDVAKPEADTAGIAVSSLASVALVVGFATRARIAGRAILGCALAFVAFVSVADLIGMKPDGSRSSDLLVYWRSELGWPLALIVATTFACAVAALASLSRARAL
jgi:hypothetical protein